MIYSLFQSLKESEVLEVPEDALKVRGRITPDKWPIEAPPIGLPVSSTLHADVPEFVPGIRMSLFLFSVMSSRLAWFHSNQSQRRSHGERMTNWPSFTK